MCYATSQDILNEDWEKEDLSQKQANNENFFLIRDMEYCSMFITSEPCNDCHNENLLPTHDL
jgi:hypothetical protein